MATGITLLLLGFVLFGKSPGLTSMAISSGTPANPATARRKSGRGPICCAVFTNCGLPVCTRSVRDCSGVSGTPDRSNAIPCRLAAAPATIGEALDVPLKDPVYQKLESAGASGLWYKLPYPAVDTPEPHPCRS